MYMTESRSPCEPSGDVSFYACPTFQKCYKFRDGDQLTSNATLNGLYEEQGGFCDCYNFWGYGVWPNCDTLSNASPIVLITTAILPFICYTYLSILVMITLWGLKKVRGGWDALCREVAYV